MGTPATTSTVYIHIIEDVINKVREEFMNNGGPGEGVLHELQGMWEMKMIQAGAILGPVDRSSISKTGPGSGPVHDLNVPYEGTEEYETPTAEMLFPPTPMQTPIPTPLPGTVQTPSVGNVPSPLSASVETSSMYNIPTGSSTDYPTPISDVGGGADMKHGRPSSFMLPPSTWVNPRPPLDVNIAYVEGREDVDRTVSQQPHTQDFFMGSAGKRKRNDLPTQYNNGGFIPQQDGAGDFMSNKQMENKNSELGYTEARVSTASSLLNLPQVDGPYPDPYDDMISTPNIYNYQEVVKEDYNIASTPAPSEPQVATPAVVAQNDTGDEDDEEPLNEDDDDDDDGDDVDQGEELNTQHLVLAQFDKVTRAKSRWKCTLKDGIMHINNKDILFNKATGEFDF